MLRLPNAKIREGAVRFLTALLLSLGMSLCALGAIFPAQPLWPAALLCGGMTLTLEALFSVRLQRKWLLPVALLVALGAWGALGGGPVFSAVQLAKAAFLSLRGIPDAALPYADTARLTLCMLFSLLACALAWDDTIPLAVLCVTLTIGLCFLFDGRAQLLLYALPAAAGLLIMLMRANARHWMALVIAALLTACAFFLTPARPAPLPAGEKAANRVRQFMEDYLLFNDFRTSFSLTDEGYQPLKDQLGGPALPERASAMEVVTDRVVLLRGRTYNDYSGLNWYDTLSSRRYLYASPRFSALRDTLFDLNRPAASGAASPQTLRIHMLSGGTTTLFAPAHTQNLQLESERMVLYFNNAGELFLTRDTATGDAYQVTYLPFAPGDAATERIIAACAAEKDENYADVHRTYTILPSHIQQDIFNIARQVTAGKATDYEKALALQDYLRANYRYTLDAQTPPDNVDFVAWFLLGAKEGYCTYFASAMTVLCRTLDIPARYVTGYVAVPDENGVALVTGEHAHAWTEIYLNGFGWLDFDPTPRNDNDRGDSDAPNSTTPPNAPTPIPTPSPSPEPEQEPEQETPASAPSEAPTPSPAPHQAAPTTTPAPTPAGEESPRSQPPRWLWLLFALLLLIALLALRYFQTEPRRAAARRPERGARLLFDAICLLLALQKCGRLPQETLQDFAARADARLCAKRLPGFAPLCEAMAAQIYGNHPADAAPFAAYYEVLKRAAPWPVRLRAVLRRMLRRNGARYRKRGK